MGSADVPPPHVPSHVIPICNSCLRVGGTLWTLAYLLYIRESRRSKSNGMPLLALAANFSWELVFALYVDQQPLEKFVFCVWLLIDCALVFGLFKYAPSDWDHAPWIAQRIKSIFGVVLVFTTLAHFSFATWWIEHKVGRKDGKPYRGSFDGPDITELSYYSSVVCQLILGVSSIAQLVVRQHSGGVNWSIWAARFLGSFIGLVLNIGWAWYFWPEGHAYFMEPPSIFLWGSSLACDMVYPLVLWNIQKSEITLPDGRKIAGHRSRSLVKNA